MKELNNSLYVFTLFNCQLARFFVIPIAFDVPGVALKRRHCHFLLGFLCCKIRVLLLLFVQVALIVAACGSAVIGPVSHANPAEIVATATVSSVARHVIAPLILLNVLLAFWARLRVGHEPGHVLTLGIVLRVPLTSRITVARLVRALTTSEASKRLTEVALNIVDHLSLIKALTSNSTLGVGTPLNVLVLVSKGLAEPLPVEDLLLWTRLEEASEI